MRTRRTWRGRTPEPQRRIPRVRLLLEHTAALLRGRRGAWAAGGALLVVCALVAVWVFGGDDEPAGPPDARARQYQDVDACLLTGEDGIAAGTPAAAVWQGMEAASGDTRARVTHVPVMGEQTAANALPHLNGLIQRDCEVVLAAGKAQTETVRKAAGDHPRVRFVVVGSSAGDQDAVAGNLTVVAPGAGLPDEVADAVRRAVNDGPQ
ncbi:BMP family ABC transporter substrate-binding protein [Streptomyces sp. NBC_00184]|uniref:BMP family ABC transporter substrate-binding protein n=1 Tax=Streptomyces sp. NBC_00184 TaxID=2975673 RepID=UPI002E2B2311|nr:BMP family ABC transporter substrate-binding protein [Streptomyces sp. NBC_00184]